VKVICNKCYVGDIKISFINKQIQALEKLILSRGGSLHKDEKRDRVIGVRQWTYENWASLVLPRMILTMSFLS